MGRNIKCVLQREKGFWDDVESPIIPTTLFGFFWDFGPRVLDKYRVNGAA
jgi:hypothetical protein